MNIPHRMLLLPVALLACMGCAHIERVRPRYEIPPASEAREVRQDEFKKHEVKKIGAFTAQIGSKTYRCGVMRRYFNDAGAAEAYDDLGSSSRARLLGLIFWVAAVPSGAFLGTVIEQAGGRRPDYTTDEFGSPGAWQGIAAGALAGGLFYAAGLWRAAYWRGQAASSFNQKLLKDLHLDIQPVSGGAKAVWQARF